MEIRPCPSKISLHGEKIDEHWWSGWPGAYCLKCDDEDKMELCLGDSCLCQCHAEFWKDCERENEEKNNK